MSNDETYEGWKNRETWAFNLHWSNDQGLYNETLERAKEWVANNDGIVTTEDLAHFDYELGEYIIGYWRGFLDGYKDVYGGPLPEGLQMFRDEVGSWWRVDATETGAAVREDLS